jgi:hypothetical protein
MFKGIIVFLWLFEPSSFREGMAIKLINPGQSEP